VRSSAAGSTLPSGIETHSPPGPLPKPSSVCQATFHSGGTQDTAVYDYDRLQPGHIIPGPSLLINAISTIVVEPGCTAHVTAAGDVRIDIAAAVKDLGAEADVTTCDPIQLAIFSHRCVSFCERLGCLSLFIQCDLHAFKPLMTPCSHNSCRGLCCVKL
jgi:Hydantoinase/oxoprolinase C-terminal domain